MQGLLTAGDATIRRFIYVCTREACRRPTLFVPSVNALGKVSYAQFPSPPTGRAIEHLPKPEVDTLWNEVRDAAKSGAPTVAVMGCRTLLHHIAYNAAADDDDVTKKQAADFSFQQSVDYLEDNGYLPPNSKEWVDEVRKKGNVANHDLVLMNQSDVELLAGFTEALLVYVYELGGKHREAKEQEQTATGSPRRRAATRSPGCRCACGDCRAPTVRFRAGTRGHPLGSNRTGVHIELSATSSVLAECGGTLPSQLGGSLRLVAKWVLQLIQDDAGGIHVTAAAKKRVRHTQDWRIPDRIRPRGVARWTTLEPAVAAQGSEGSASAECRISGASWGLFRASQSVVLRHRDQLIDRRLHTALLLVQPGTKLIILIKAASYFMALVRENNA